MPLGEIKSWNTRVEIWSKLFRTGVRFPPPPPFLYPFPNGQKPISALILRASPRFSPFPPLPVFLRVSSRHRYTNRYTVRKNETRIPPLSSRLLRLCPRRRRPRPGYAPLCASMRLYAPPSASLAPLASPRGNGLHAGQSAIFGPINSPPVRRLPPPPSIRPSVANGRPSRGKNGRIGQKKRHRLCRSAMAHRAPSLR